MSKRRQKLKPAASQNKSNDTVNVQHLQDEISDSTTIKGTSSTHNVGQEEKLFGIRIGFLAIGLILGFGLGWFAAKYHLSTVDNKMCHCGADIFEDLDALRDSTPIFQKAQCNLQNNFDERGKFNGDLSSEFGEEINVGKPIIYQNNGDDVNKKESVDDSEEIQRAPTDTEQGEQENRVLKTFKFQDGKIQEQESKSSDEQTTNKEVNEEKKIKDFKPTDGLSVKSSAMAYTPTYLEGLDVGYSIRVGENIVSPKELTNGTGPVRAYIYEHFLTPKECEGLMGAHNRHVSETNKNDPLICFDSISTLRKHLKDARSKYKVTEKDFTEGTTCMNATFSKKLKKLLKWSYSTAFYPGESKFSTIFEQRVLEATGLSPENGGKLQITSYKEGIGYKTHTDCTVGSADRRDRVATILVYLQDVADGGETKFPDLNISVRPVKGRALVWNNMNPNGDCLPLSIHEAAKVKEGHKYILQRWYYYESFYHLGKRPSEPSLPERAEGQPQVSCDEYENGSCRWYDEWNYDHIVDYRATKSKLS